MKPLEKGSTDLWSRGGWGGVGGRDKELESLETAGDLGCLCYQSVDSHGKASCLYRGGQKEVYRDHSLRPTLNQESPASFFTPHSQGGGWGTA